MSTLGAARNAAAPSKATNATTATSTAGCRIPSRLRTGCAMAIGRAFLDLRD